jgi:hypothetical protein
VACVAVALQGSLYARQFRKNSRALSWLPCGRRDLPGRHIPHIEDGFPLIVG